MYDDLLKLSRHLLSISNRSYQRYFLKTTKPKHRLNILLGQRGVGKTTTLVQYLLEKTDNNINDPKILYLPVDHILLEKVSLYEIADTFQSLGGRYIAFDEIHKCPSWSRELKSIYDTFPKLTVIASGSSALEIQKASYDLSRRAIEYHLPGLSFREFIEIQYGIQLQTITLDELINKHEKNARGIIEKLDKQHLKILPLFKRYLNQGFYPYFLEFEDVNTYWLTLEQNVRTTLDADLIAIYPQLTGNSIKKIKQLLIFIAENVPFTPAWAKLKNIIDITDNRTLKNYFKYLEDANLIRSVTSYSKNMRQLEKDEKIYLNNPNQAQALSAGKGNIGTLREIFFLCMLSVDNKVNIPLTGDFIVNDTYTFEIGGRKKEYKKIKDAQKAYLICDDIEIGVNQRIPLWLAGFLY